MLLSKPSSHQPDSVGSEMQWRSHLTPYTLHLKPYTSYLTPHTLHLTPHQPDTADCPPARELSGPTTLPGFPLIWFGRIWIRKILARYKDLSFLHVNGSNCPLSLSPFFVPLVWRGGCWMAGWWLYQHIRFAAILRRDGGRWEDKELNSFLCPPPLGGQCLLWEYQGLQTQTQTYNLDRILQITGQWSYHFYKEII